jgi:hypothetical protein
MTALATIASPIVSFLDFSGRAVLRALGYRERPEHRVTDEEIRSLMAEAETAGDLEPGERAMIAGVMRLGDRPPRRPVQQTVVVERHDDRKPVRLRQRSQATREAANIRNVLDGREADDDGELPIERSGQHIALDEFDIRTGLVCAEVDVPLYAAAAVRSPRKQESAPLNSCRPGSIHLQTFAVEPAAAVATSRCCLELT